MSRFNINKKAKQEEKPMAINPMQGKSFLELLIQDTTEDEQMPEDLFDEPIAEIPIPNRKKRFKFLRFPKLKAMLDQLDQEPEDADAYVIMDDHQNEEDMKKEVMKQWEKEQRNDTEEFLNNIEEKLKSLGKKGREPKPKLNQGQNQDFEKTILHSITEDEEVVSETLANILAMQGKNKKAIKMYKALSLKFPEKSRLFAQKIKELE